MADRRRAWRRWMGRSSASPSIETSIPAPVRLVPADGTNLIAKALVASRGDEQGASTFTDTAHERLEALIANPYDEAMTSEEQQSRKRGMVAP